MVSVIEVLWVGMAGVLCLLYCYISMPLSWLRGSDDRIW